MVSNTTVLFLLIEKFYEELCQGSSSNWQANAVNWEKVSQRHELAFRSHEEREKDDLENFLFTEAIGEKIEEALKKSPRSTVLPLFLWILRSSPTTTWPRS